MLENFFFVTLMFSLFIKFINTGTKKHHKSQDKRNNDVQFLHGCSTSLSIVRQLSYQLKVIQKKFYSRNLIPN